MAGEDLFCFSLRGPWTLFSRGRGPLLHSHHQTLLQVQQHCHCLHHHHCNVCQHFHHHTSFFRSSATHPSCRRRLNALEDTDVVLDFAEAVTSTSVKQSKSKEEEFGTFCNPRLEDEDLENGSRSWNHSPASPFLIRSNSQSVHQLNPTSPFKQFLGSNSHHQSSSQSNPFQPVTSEIHLQQQQQSNSRETFHPSISQDPLNCLGPLQQSSEDPYNEDIWAAYSKNAQEVLSYQGGFESGPEWSGAHILPSLQLSSVELLLGRLRIFEPPNVDNVQSWLENFDSIFRFQLLPNLCTCHARTFHRDFGLNLLFQRAPCQ